jgi:Mn-dependent DtxR family transcriptional regulator
MRYVQARIIQIGQTAACNRYHNIDRRFARWLLTVRDSIQQEKFQLTQEFISQMLGVRRSGITEVASKFQKAGIIHYKRGAIEIVSSEKLEASSCARSTQVLSLFSLCCCGSQTRFYLARLLFDSRNKSTIRSIWNKSRSPIMGQS